MDTSLARPLREPGLEHGWMFDALVDQSLDLVARFDSSLCVLYVNAAVERMTGLPRQLVLGRTLGELDLPRTLADSWRSWVAQALASGREELFHFQYRTPLGLVAFEVRAIPELDAGGRVASVVTVLRDVTERLRAERAADRAVRLQAITSTLSQQLTIAEAARGVLEQVTRAVGAVAGVVYLLDRDGQTLVASGAVGYTPEQQASFERVPLSAALPIPDAVREGRPVWLDTLAELAPRYHSMKAHVRRAGAAAVPLVVDGRAVGGVGLSFNRPYALNAEDREFCLAVASQCAQALDRARVHEALRANEARFRRLVNSNLIGVAFSDGGDALTGANDAFLGLLGYAREELEAGQVRWRELTAPGHPDREVHAPCAAYEKEYLRKDGGRVPVLVGSAALDEDCTEWACFVVDLTERVRKDAELRKSRDQLDVILRAVVEGITAQAPDGRLVFANDAAARDAGYASVEELLADAAGGADSRAELLDEEGRPFPPARAPGRVALMGKRPPETVLRTRERATGRERWFLVNAVPLLDETGCVRMALTISHDVTAQKQAERRITEESRINETLRRIGESFAAELDLPRLVQRITQEATALTGARFGAFFQVPDGEELEAPSLSGAEEEGSAWFARAEAEALRRAIFAGEGALRLEDVGASRYASAGAAPGGVRGVLAVPVVSRSGKVLGGLFFGHAEAARFTPVHERMVGGVAAQAAIALDNARLYREAQEAERRAAFLSEATALLASSLEEEATLARLASLAVPRLADWCAVEWFADVKETRRAVAHVEPDKVAAAEELRRRYPPAPDAPYGISAVLRTGVPELYPTITDENLVQFACEPEHLRLLRVVGMRSLMLVPIALRGAPLGVITFAVSGGRRFTASDLALARSLADRAAVAIDNARLYRATQQAVRVREEFMSIASHELRTPLTPLQLQLSSLLRSLRALPESCGAEKLSHKVETAVRQTVRLTSLVNSLLDVTRISSGRFDLHLEEMDLAAMVREVAERFSGELESAGCAFSVAADGEVRGRWDRGRLEQVITNLLTNALKYGAGRPVALEVRAAVGGAALRVADQGIGIAPEDQARIFERFERAASPDAYGGLGLGLYIARRIVAAHGGQIDVRSAAGEGSTFTVRLPAEPPARPEG